MQGESGSAIAQRSVISEHRNEREAREAASQERRRLEVIRAEEAASWLITVMRGDEVVHQERPFDGRREAVPVPPVSTLGITQREADEPVAEEEPVGDEPAGADDEPAGADDEPAGADEEPTGADEQPGAGEQPAEAVEEPSPEPEVTGTMPVAIPAGLDDPDAHPLPEFLGGPPVGAAGAPPPRGNADRADESGEPAQADEAREPRQETESDQSGEPGRSEDAGEDDEGADADQSTQSLATTEGGEGDGPPSAPTGSDRDEDAIPSGPVPDEIIRRFEESLARERARARRGD
jgi:hypothetical protein